MRIGRAGYACASAIFAASSSAAPDIQARLALFMLFSRSEIRDS
jgi:hypothetical protein